MRSQPYIFKVPCPSGKLPFWSLHDANKDAKRINQSNKKRSSIPAEAYRCKKCNLWHVGRNRRKEFSHEGILD